MQYYHTRTIIANLEQYDYCKLIKRFCVTV